MKVLRLESDKRNCFTGKWKALTSIMGSMKNDVKLGVGQTNRRNQTKQASGRDRETICFQYMVK